LKEAIVSNKEIDISIIRVLFSQGGEFRHASSSIHKVISDLCHFLLERISLKYDLQEKRTMTLTERRSSGSFSSGIPDRRSVPRKIFGDFYPETARTLESEKVSKSIPEPQTEPDCIKICSVGYHKSQRPFKDEIQRYIFYLPRHVLLQGNLSFGWLYKSYFTGS
jgi:hypothetical protein